MRQGELRSTFVGRVVAQFMIFVASLPPFGIETRTPSEYSAWAGPVFLLLTVLVFLLGVVALILSRSRVQAALRLGIGPAAAAIVTNQFDISHTDGPPPHRARSLWA